jgi:hypothetical protein
MKTQPTAGESGVFVLSEPSFGFDDRGPFFHVGNGTYKKQEFVDPVPCYGCDEDLVRREYDAVTARAPLPIPIAYYVLSRELGSRTNGHYCDDYIYDDNRKVTIGGEHRYQPTGYIVLSGKRIPIHPAMVRYLVSHEYGHAVEYYLAKRRGKQRLLEDYVQLRGRELGRIDVYGPGSWHRHAGEVFANDFRIMVMQREVEFWPHELPPPTALPDVRKWWADAALELSWPAEATPE